MTAPDATHPSDSALSQLIDGELFGQRAYEVREHLAACDLCQAAHDELCRLRDAARELPLCEPPAGLFEKVLGAMEASGELPADPAAAAAGLTVPSLARSRRTRTRVAALVAGGAVLAAAAAFALLVTRTVTPRTDVAALPAPRANLPSEAQGPARAASDPIDPLDSALMASAQAELRRGEEHYTRAIDELRKLAAEERVRWPADVAASFDQTLAEIDRAVERTREVARRSPTDADAEDLLVSAYRREVDFLEEMIVRGTASRGTP